MRSAPRSASSWRASLLDLRDAVLVVDDVEAVLARPRQPELRLVLRLDRVGMSERAGDRLRRRLGHAEPLHLDRLAGLDVLALLDRRHLDLGGVVGRDAVAAELLLLRRDLGDLADQLHVGVGASLRRALGAADRRRQRQDDDRDDSSPHLLLPFVSFRVFRGDSLPHSHSIVAGGLLEMSYTTRLTPLTSLMIRVEIFASSSYGRCDQSAVM